MDLVGMKVEDNRRRVKMTVLRRNGGKWHLLEVNRLVVGLKTEASQHPQYSEYVVLFGHFSKEQALKALLGGEAFIATQVIGIQTKDLPFNPGWV